MIKRVFDKIFNEKSYGGDDTRYSIMIQSVLLARKVYKTTPNEDEQLTSLALFELTRVQGGGDGNDQTSRKIRSYLSDCISIMRSSYSKEKGHPICRTDIPKTTMRRCIAFKGWYPHFQIPHELQYDFAYVTDILLYATNVDEYWRARILRHVVQHWCVSLGIFPQMTMDDYECCCFRAILSYMLLQNMPRNSVDLDRLERYALVMVGLPQDGNDWRKFDEENEFQRTGTCSDEMHSTLLSFNGKIFQSYPFAGRMERYKQPTPAELMALGAHQNDEFTPQRCMFFLKQQDQENAWDDNQELDAIKEKIKETPDDPKLREELHTIEKRIMKREMSPEERIMCLCADYSINQVIMIQGIEDDYVLIPNNIIANNKSNDKIVAKIVGDLAPIYLEYAMK